MIRPVLHTGRKDLHDNSGYVGNYKGDKTYDDK